MENNVVFFMVTIERLRELFAIDPETGIIIRLIGKQGCPVGTEAGGLSTKGYRQIRVDGIHIEGHRVAWALYYGSFPSAWVDHRNGVRTDNRKHNLRLATHAQSARNAIGRSASGRKGVYWCKPSKKWMATIKIARRSKTLGYFDNLDDADEFRQLAADLLHGEFANHVTR